jgi:hypothetical protein
VITLAKLNRPKTIFTTTFLVLIAFTLPAFAHSTHGPGHKTGVIGHTPCNDGVVVLSPNTLWPTNHKWHTVDVAYIDNDNEADAVSLAINSISSNQDSPDGPGVRQSGRAR